MNQKLAPKKPLMPVPFRSTTPSARRRARSSQSIRTSRRPARFRRQGMPGCASIRAGMPRKGSRPSRKAATATSLAALSMAGAVPPVRERGVGQPQAGEGVEVRRLEIEAGQCGQVERARRPNRSVPARPGHGRARCACRGCPAAPAPSHPRSPPANGSRSAGAPRTSMRVGRQAEQVVRLDDFQALVHQRRGVHRDLAAHHPVRVGAGLVRRDVAQRVAAAAAEGSARGGRAAGGARRRGCRRRAGTGRWRCVRCRSAAAWRRCRAAAAHQHLAGEHHRFLVRQQQALAGAGRGEGRGDAGRADDGGDHGVARRIAAAISSSAAVPAIATVSRPERCKAVAQALEQRPHRRSTATRGRKRRHSSSSSSTSRSADRASTLEAVGMAGDDVQRGGADRTGRPEQRDPARGFRAPAIACPATKIGSAASRLSMRSSTPPCPGMRWLESLAPAWRLSRLSNRSPGDRDQRRHQRSAARAADRSRQATPSRPASPPGRAAGWRPGRRASLPSFCRG